MSRRPLTVSGLVASLAVALALSGCVSIPESSSVREGREVDVQGEPRVINNIPVGPSPGASPLDVVSGYFAAMLAYPQTYDVAREYLTPTAAASWTPGGTVVVYDKQAIVERGGFVAVEGDILGSLDDRGTWTTAPPGQSSLRTQFRLTQIDGEWRIVNPLPALYVDRDFFQRSYSQFSLYFFDPTQLVLTPDPVYLLIGDDTASTLVDNLLHGPTRDLTGIVETLVPDGLELDGPVEVSSTGAASVPLSDQILTIDESDRQLFAAQLTWTLRQLPEVADVSVTLDGEALDIAGVGTRIGDDELTGYDPAGLSASRQLFALSPKGLVRLDSDGVVLESGPISEASMGARAVAVDQTGQLGAVVSGDGRTVYVGGVNAGSEQEERVWLTGATNLLRPSWDVHGVLWVVDRQPGGSVVRAMTGPGAGEPLSTPEGLSGKDIQGFAVSRDGVRFAAVVAEGDEARLVIAKIDRLDDRPRQVMLLRLREVLSPDITLTGISGLAWSSPTDVVLLANGEAGDRQVYEVSIDGSAVEAMTGFLPSRPLSLAAGSNEDAPLAIGGRNGNVYVQTPDFQWVEVPSAQRLWAPSYPG
ncbi:MAG: LpqB family beta-propeller domain-containing protein [Nocardioidaceae bacterium]